MHSRQLGRPDHPLMLCILLTCCFAAKADAENSKTLQFPSLPDGVYLIERTIFSPPKIFYSKEEAEAYIEQLKKHPELDASQSPEVSFYQFYVQQDGFVIHQVVRTNETEYVGKGNFFVSVNGKENWAFEERGHTITLITNSPNYGLADAGPIAGLLKTGQAFYDNLSALGTDIIGSPAVISKGQLDFITGHTKQGHPYHGEVRYDSDGRATNVLCIVENSSNPYDLSLDISYSGNATHPVHVLQTRRKTGQSWRRAAEYKILNVSSVPALFRMETFWTGFMDVETRVVVYDPATKSRSFIWPPQPRCW